VARYVPARDRYAVDRDEDERQTGDDCPSSEHWAPEVVPVSIRLRAESRSNEHHAVNEAKYAHKQQRAGNGAGPTPAAPEHRGKDEADSDDDKLVERKRHDQPRLIA
jgi:hypothetical protein